MREGKTFFLGEKILGASVTKKMGNDSGTGCLKNFLSEEQKPVAKACRRVKSVDFPKLERATDTTHRDPHF